MRPSRRDILIATRRSQLALAQSEMVGRWIHKLNPKVGLQLVQVESEGDKAKLEALGKQIAMHVAAAFPQYLTKNEVDDSVLERERSVLLEQAKTEGKPVEIAQKMVEGRIRKFYEEVCLLEQAFIHDTGKSVAQAVKDAEGIAHKSGNLHGTADLAAGSVRPRPGNRQA